MAGRSYVDSEMSDDPWISSHLELRDEQGELVSGYGWIFPLGDGTVNLGAGTLATSKRPAEVAIKPLMQTYADTIGADFGLSGELRMPTSALLPMGGAVSNVAGPNWALIGDAAACVNPLNGEGIDYGLETGRLVAEQIASGVGLGEAWRSTLVEHYGEAFSIARRLAGIATQPKVVLGARPGRDALRLADDAGPALDGQPRRRRRPRPRGAGLALGRPPLGGARRPATVRVSREQHLPGGRPRSVGAGMRRARRCEVTGRSVPSTVPTDGPVLLAATHVSYPDFVFMRGRRPVVGPLRAVHDPPRRVGGARRARGRWSAMRHVPVDREAPAGAYLVARRLLRDGEAVCAFPEAGISYSYTVRSLMRGVASAGPGDRRPRRAGGAVGRAAGLLGRRARRARSRAATRPHAAVVGSTSASARR